VEELRSVFDPKGGYWNKGKYVPSLIAEIGNVIETHLTEIGMLKVAGLDEHQQAFLADKQAELQAQQQADEQQAGSGFHRCALLQVPQQGAGAEGWLHDLSQLRRFQVRLSD
jgi:hypothetical protein